jgi:hypothetical protein
MNRRHRVSSALSAALLPLLGRKSIAALNCGSTNVQSGQPLQDCTAGSELQSRDVDPRRSFSHHATWIVAITTCKLRVVPVWLTT